VERGLWGIENLSLIPGTVGAAPMQNIGAYGGELKDVLENVQAFGITEENEGKKRIFTREECALGYRDSIFKNTLKDKYFISAITLKLSKIGKPNISYKILKQYLEDNKIEIKNSRDISDAVASIRRSKLPDPKVIGNAGSFFKNVFLQKKELDEFLKKYPDAPYFEEPADAKALAGKGGVVKIPAGWLIEKALWKGKRVGNVGVHDKQALVLVNHGGATGQEIKELAEKIARDVKEKFGLELILEVNLIP
jgi:UDP-N-acetylmuramate dehydrogenase